jgi:hypothetical protein
LGIEIEGLELVTHSNSYRYNQILDILKGSKQEKVCLLFVVGCCFASYSHFCPILLSQDHEVKIDETKQQLETEAPKSSAESATSATATTAASDNWEDSLGGFYKFVLFFLSFAFLHHIFSIISVFL